MADEDAMSRRINDIFDDGGMKSAGKIDGSGVTVLGEWLNDRLGFPEPSSLL
jgi:hypothetical protein